MQWRRIMGASGDRGKNITTVLQSPLGLDPKTAPNTVIPGSPMPVYSGDRGYRPPPPRAPGAPPPPRPSLFGPLEARRDWAVAKVRELEAIAADPNRSQPDRDSARRGARLITRDIAQYQGMPFTQADLDAEANPLLARMEAWQGISLPHPETPVEQSSYHKERKDPSLKSSYERARENLRLKQARPKRKSPPSDHMQVLIFDEHGEALRKATLLADHAHDDGDLTLVTLNHRVDHVDADGSYRAADGAVGARIGIRRECAYPLLTTLHEIGHHLRARLDPAIIAKIAEMARNSESGQICKSIGLDESYWLSESEIFSRVYSQWVLEKTGDTEAAMELRSIMEGSDAWQQFRGKEWTEISKMVDTLMKKKGWL